jgi:peptide/nickel transport system permease protein
MAGYVLRRLTVSLVTLWLVSVVVFLLSRTLGDPQALFLDPSATADDRARLEATLGLDAPLLQQYVIFVGNALVGNLGRSYSLNQPVLDVFWNRFLNTVELGAVAFVCGMAIAVPVGIFAALHRESAGDWVARVFVFLGQALPQFWLGIMLILLVSVQWNLLPPAGKGGPATFILPAITLGWSAAAGVSRLVRSSILDVLSNDFIRTARAKGLSETVVNYRHALRNALLPVVAYSSLILVRSFIFGSITVETVFGWPGVGRLAFDATMARDYPLIQGIVLMMAVIVIAVTFCTEVTYGLLDPRIRRR